MKFSEVCEHLGKQGFICKLRNENNKLYWNKNLIWFGIDNALWYTQENWHDGTFPQQAQRREWAPCLADFHSDDWLIIPFYWKGLSVEKRQLRKLFKWLNTQYPQDSNQQSRKEYSLFFRTKITNHKKKTSKENYDQYRIY